MRLVRLETQNHPLGWFAGGAESDAKVLGRRHFQSALHRRTREAAIEPRPYMKKAVEADDLARFVKADQVAHPAEQRNIGDAVVSADHPVAAREVA